MKNFLLILAIGLSFAFVGNRNSIDTYLGITDGINTLSFYIENDTAFIECELPIVILAPNTFELEPVFDSIFKLIEDLDSCKIAEGLYKITPQENLTN